MIEDWISVGIVVLATLGGVGVLLLGFDIVARQRFGISNDTHWRVRNG